MKKIIVPFWIPCRLLPMRVQEAFTSKHDYHIDNNNSQCAVKKC